MDALFSRNVEDKEVFFKKNDNVEGVVENVREVKTERTTTIRFWRNPNPKLKSRRSSGSLSERALKRLRKI